MPGILDIYVTACHGHIEAHLKNKTLHQVSRAIVEFTILTQLDRASFPMEFKATWYHAVTTSPSPSKILFSDRFESLWKSKQQMYKLSEEQLERFIPDETKMEYQVPKEEEFLFGEDDSFEDDESLLTVDVRDLPKKEKRRNEAKRGGKNVKVRVTKGGAVGKIRSTYFCEL
ncbi:MAG: hypothetical protein M1836_000620 [Candelina mexicana]|nr:MAG: hypothetical protein M1836_000620 [Candelina mexicana]